VPDKSISRKEALESPESYFRWRVARAKEIVLLAQKYASFRKKQILDLGCGEGPLSYLLYKKGAKVHAIDISKEALKRMRKFTKNMKINIKKAPAENLPYKDNFFDIIFTFDVIEHVKDYKKTFIEMNRCLKNGGYIFLEMTPYWALATGHHLYDFTHLPVQYLPKKLMRWWIFKKKAKGKETPKQAWEQFVSLNKISITQVRKLARKHNFKILEENFIFKIPRFLEVKINWIKNFGFLKEIIPMSYQAVFNKAPIL